MAALDDLAAQLAKDTMDAMDETGEDRLFMEVAGVLGAASQTLEEAYLTEVRVRLAARRAEKFLTEKLAALRAAKTSSDPSSL